MKDIDKIEVKGAPPMAIEIDYGPDGVRAVYFRLTDNKVARTIEADETDVLIDVDSKNKIVGIELINPAKVRLKKLFREVTKRFRSTPLRHLGDTRIRELQKMVTV